MATPAEPTYQEQTFPTIDEAEEAAVREGRRSTSPEPNVNQGGHGGIRPLGAARQILEKPAPFDSVENEFYRRIRDGAYPDLAPVVPASYTADQVRERLGDQLDAPAGDALDDRRHIYIENITSDLSQPKTLDAKIGRSTTSYRENKAQQEKSSWDAGVKSFKFALGIDPMTGSTQRGWRIVAGTDASGIRVLDGMQSQSILSKFSEDPAVWDQLIGKMQDIRNAAARSDLGFIAASVFSVHGTQNGETKVDARLIDFAHAIDARNPFKQSPSPSPEGSPRLGGGPAAPDLTRLKDKYRNQFLAGMDSLIKDATRVRTTKTALATMNPTHVRPRSTSPQQQPAVTVPTNTTNTARRR
ncbi:inositol polyphosphate kinase family protein [Streptomyces hirsutus]|uniref:inositol polyphosphate kinase family protein n=1 Tax=Streptomyces hirsutus TaxID=35620 RepID=UPI00369F14BD